MLFFRRKEVLKRNFDSSFDLFIFFENERAAYLCRKKGENYVAIINGEFFFKKRFDLKTII